jgi:acetyl-CoA acyltransferase 2
MEKRMGELMQEVYILSAKRTPFGAFGGTLKSLSATDLAVKASEAALSAAGVKAEDVEHVVMGNVAQTAADAIYLPRHVGLRCGVPDHVPALGVNRLCGSGFQAIVTAVHHIWAGEAEVVLAGGTESMSQAPHVIRGARWGLPLAKGELEDSLWSSLTDSHVQMPMAMTAERLAEQYQISQSQVDEYSLGSQQKFAAAQEAGYFDAELTPVEIKKRKGVIRCVRDEHNRPDTTLAGLAKLPKVFKKDGVIHAGAASGIADGAASLVIASKTFVDKEKLQPLARIVGWGVSGCDPKIMGIGPVPAIQNLLRRHDMQLNDFELVEVNEAFAPQVLAVQRDLGILPERLNVNGGAIAVGHPLGASGARIAAHLVHELRRRGLRLGLGSACIGGGQGIAVAIESMN